jgi:hypothetical protein
MACRGAAGLTGVLVRGQTQSDVAGQGIGGGRGRCLLEEQLESELVVLGGGEAAIYQVIEADEVAAGMGAEGGAEDGTGESADHGAEDERPDWRARRHLNGGSLRFDRQIGWLVDVSQHLLILPKPR